MYCIKRLIPVLSAIAFFSFSSPVLSAIINASSPSLSDIQAAVYAANTGDTVIVPSGNSTWNSKLTIPDDLKITIQGAGINKTNITRSSQGEILDFGKSGSRVTGFSFKNGTIFSEGHYFRFDHCSISLDNWTNGITVQSINNKSPNTHLATGLIDNCIFSNMRILAGGTNFLLKEDDSQHDLWANPLDLGGPSAVYIEDCTFDGGINAVDGNYGGRYVFRYNSIKDVDIEAHSVQSTNRAIRRWEIYRNNIVQTSGFQQIFLRGGTGTVFDNTLSGTVYFRLDNVRSSKAAGDGGQCAGSSNWDGNKDYTGWPCRDQIGQGGDTRAWTTINPYSPQISSAAYFWNNLINGDPFPAKVVNDSDEHIKPNRDFYDYSPSFDGTEGVGVGKLANRPSTCTTGVGYWATDQGNWNKSGSGEQGVLYKCTSSNKWEAYYTPYEYPHPLRNGEIPPATGAPGETEDTPSSPGKAWIE